MTLSLDGCYAHIRHTLRGNPAKELTLLSLLNMTGVHMCNMWDWKWLERPSVVLPTVLGQEWSPLPSDFGSAIALVATDSFEGSFEFTTFKKLQLARTAGVTLLATDYVGAIEHAPSASADGGPPEARLGLYPAAEASLADAFTLTYRAGWDQMGGDPAIQHVTLDESCEPLFIQMLRVFARGWEREDEAEMNLRLVAIRDGPLFADAKRFDMAKQLEYGPITGGAAQFAQGIRYIRTPAVGP